MMRKQDNRDHGEHRPSLRSSREESPEQARQARHEEGQRWVRMDADDATWARTPEERAWRELNAVTKAEQATAPEAGGDKRFRLSDLFTFQPEQTQGQRPGQVQETSERPLSAGAAQQDAEARPTDAYTDYDADIQAVYDAAGHEAACHPYDDYISNYPLYTNYSNYYLIDDYYLADDYYYLPAYYPEYYATDGYTHGYMDSYTLDHTTTYTHGYINIANDLVFGSMLVDRYQSQDYSQSYEPLNAESALPGSRGYDCALVENPQAASGYYTQSHIENAGSLEGRSDYLHASAAAVVSAPLYASFEDASGLTVNPPSGGAAGQCTSPLADYPIGLTVNPIDAHLHGDFIGAYEAPSGNTNAYPNASHPEAPLPVADDAGSLYASFANAGGSTVNPQGAGLFESAVSASTAYAAPIIQEPASSVLETSEDSYIYSSWSHPEAAPLAAGDDASLYARFTQTGELPVSSPADYPIGLTVNPQSTYLSEPMASAPAFSPSPVAAELVPGVAETRDHTSASASPLYASLHDVGESAVEPPPDPSSGLTVNPPVELLHQESQLQENAYLTALTVNQASGNLYEPAASLPRGTAAGSVLGSPDHPLYIQQDSDPLCASFKDAGGLTVNPVDGLTSEMPVVPVIDSQAQVLQSAAYTSSAGHPLTSQNLDGPLCASFEDASGLTVNPLAEVEAARPLEATIGAWFATEQESPAADRAPVEDFIVASPSKHQKAEGLLLEDEDTLRLQGAVRQLSGSAAVESVLSDEALSPPEPHRRAAASPSGSSEKSASRSMSEGARAELKAAGLGVAGLAGGAVLSGVKTTAGAANAVIERAMREDENLARVADTEDVLLDAVMNMRGHAAGSLDGKSSLAGLGGMKNPKAPAEDKLLKAKRATIREKASAVDGADLREKLSAEDALDAKPSALEEKPAGIRGKAVEAAQIVGAEEHLIGREGSEKPKKADAKNRFEKKLAKKRQDRLAKKDAKGKSALEAVKKPGVKTALLVKGAAFSSAEKVLTKKNEELAIAVSMAKKARKVENAVKAPVKVYRQAKTALSAAYHAVKGTVQGIIALGSSGPVGLVIVLVLFLLLVFAIAALIGSASVINDEQEISEVSALVAELDEKMTEEIHGMGVQGVLYCDARNTYGESSGGKDLTKDVDLADDKSDLKEVDAGSVTVQTDPGEIVAYIDAKYTGKWQVGAASWKFTIDAFGATWNVIQWDNMPEWCWKALNKVSRENLRNKLSVRVFDILRGEYDVEVEEAVHLSEGIADEFANVLYDQQIQDINEEVLTQVISDAIKKQSSSLELSKKEIQKLYYELQDIVAEVIASKEPLAFVYDEIVALHADINWWSEKYQSFEVTGDDEKAPAAPVEGTGSGTNNKSGYPNSTGYDAKELEKWDGFNEVSVYGISEAGTTSVTADGTKITNTWSDTNMAIACEGLQNEKYAYWSKAYRNATGLTDPKPVVITLYNPSTGKTVSAEVRDCGGWRGFNKKYAGMNADRQWDLLPAVWKALGGTPTSGLMKVYWKVDPNAVVGGGGELEPMDFEDYPWPKESDKGDGTITLNRPTLVVHSIHDALNNDPLMDEIIGKDNYATKAEFIAVKNMVVTKVRGIMRGFLTMENEKGDLYTDYLYFRRNLPSPFGEEKGNSRQWIIVKRFNPGYDDFDHDKVEIEIEPLDDVKDVYAIKKGIVRKVKDGKVTVRMTIDSKTSADVTYAELEDITVEKLNKVKRGQKLGTMKSSALKIAYYEVNTPLTRIHTNKKWAYDPGMFMMGFAGYKQADAPKAYSGGSAMRDYSDCKTIVEFAQSRLGCPYVWGATGPDTFDCSGLTQWCYKQAGISIPRNSEGQHSAAVSAGNCHPINEANMQPGDIVWRSGHVGIYIGSNKYIHAPQSGDVVKVSTNIKSFTSYLRFGK